MSDDELDVQEVVRSLISGCEDFVVTHIEELQNVFVQKVQSLKEQIECLESANSSLRVKVTTLESEVSVLKTKNDELENRVNNECVRMKNEFDTAINALPRCQCRELFAACVVAYQYFLDGGVLTATPLEGQEAVATNHQDNITSQSSPPHEQNVDATCSEIMDTQKVPSMFYTPAQHEISEGASCILNAKCKEKIQSSLDDHFSETGRERQGVKCYERLEELPERFRELVQPFYKPKSPLAKCDLLTDLQKAYVEYRCENKDTLSPGNLAKEIISSGVNDKIWGPGFSPKAGGSFCDYLRQRIKNRRTRRNLKELRFTQKDRLKRKLNKVVKEI